MISAKLKPIALQKSVKKMKKQDKDWEKISVIHISNEDLMSKIMRSP